jgi:asparagine synthase (glutamine-hydrolysing)
MSVSLAHRGPDEGLHTNGSIAIGCHRFTAKTPSDHKQPVSNEDGSIWAVADCEIYNSRSLRGRLEDGGRAFRTGTEVEAIVHLYEELGPDCVKELRGMFAFALWDDRRQLLLLARDHLGQKPLFFSQTREAVYFASEVKAIIAARGSRPEVDLESLYHYLSMRFVPAPGTMVRGIGKLPPGHFLTYSNGLVQRVRYWRPNFEEKLEESEAAFIEGLSSKLEETVSIHLRADVPVGAFLSGGLDSSLIVAKMAKVLKEPFPTFSVGVAESDFNELPYARLVSDTFRTKQYETQAETDLISLLPTIIWHLDEPSDPVAGSKYVVSRLAAPHAKVVLGGDGGDELFAGFDRYRGVRYAGYYAHVPSLLRDGLIAPLIDRIPSTFGYENLAQKVQWMNRLARIGDVGERFAAGVAFFRFNRDEKGAVLSDAAWEEVQHLRSHRLLTDVFAECGADDIIEKMLYTDYTMRLPEHSLMLSDRMGMAHGVQVRSPLVDKDLVEYVAAFPLRLKVRGNRSKYAERKLAERELPELIVRRRKQGFRLPLAAWFGRELYQPLSSLFSRSRMVRDGILRRDTALRLLEEHRQRRADHHVRLWMLLNLELWYQLVIEQHSPDDVAAAMRG